MIIIGYGFVVLIHDIKARGVLDGVSLIAVVAYFTFTRRNNDTYRWHISALRFLRKRRGCSGL
ncbi:hypothetical protein [Candidatus Ichthyocystis sparus]|uniref:hypothetical protein n=1 Tax=Candidatus Ichthyocystis sparus TaxID=1561004 RepID=UPI00159EDF30|nr:hypothetical protein [Candidatus Ichthyocystis sparus]